MSDIALPMPEEGAAKRFTLQSMPGILFAVLVIVFAVGNSWVGIYPYGKAVWIRPLLGLVGIVGAVCLFRGNGWWKVLLPVWSFLQVWIIATDVSKEWFYQGLMLGSTTRHTTTSNHLVTQYRSHGINYAGFILLAMVGAIATFRLHPPVRRPIHLKRPKLIALVGLMAAILVGGASFFRYQAQARADFVLDLDLPYVPIYYEDKLLGHTPLSITPELVRNLGLPLNPDGHLRLFGTGWADCQILTDGVTRLPLYAGVPMGFSNTVDVFETPWGTRARFHTGHESGNRQWGYVYPKAELRNEPILTIQVRDPMPLAAGTPLRLHVELRNPTARDYVGRKVDLSRKIFPFGQRSDAAPNFAREGRVIEMPASWNRLPRGGAMSADVEFALPPDAGEYELFCTWFMFENKPDSNQGSGSFYSNVLRLTVR